MGRKKLNISEEEKKERIRQQYIKYLNSNKGKEKQKEAIKKYQQTEKYKNYKKDYYRRIKEE